MVQSIQERFTTMPGEQRADFFYENSRLVRYEFGGNGQFGTEPFHVSFMVTYEYDGDRRVGSATSVFDIDEFVTTRISRYGYDGQGRFESITAESLDEVTGATVTGTMTFLRDDLGRIVEIRAGDKLTVFTYDGNHNIELQETLLDDGSGEFVPTLRFTFEYDDAINPLFGTYPQRIIRIAGSWTDFFSPNNVTKSTSINAQTGEEVVRIQLEHEYANGVPVRTVQTVQNLKPEGLPPIIIESVFDYVPES